MNLLKVIKHIVSIVLISLFVVSCSLNIDNNRPTNIQYIDQNDATWLQHLSKLEAITQYKATGQLGYISAKERFSTQFEWQYNNQNSYSLFISSALSRSTLLLEMQGNKLTISDNKGNYRSEKEANILLREMIGVEVPLEKLTLWLKGQPERNTQYNVGTNHLLANFNYNVDGTLWTVDYLNYHHKFEIPMPRDILLKNKEQTLKVRIENWEY